jgi:hydroxyacyl-ACP dehydratase HTD2-like protein with hotdog domain
VQGPLLAAILMQRAARAALPWVPVSFTYRAERPAFLGEDIRVVWSSQDNEQIRIAALTADDGVAMSAVLFVQPPFKETAP